MATWYAAIVCETMPQTEHLPCTCEHPDIGIDVGLQSFLTDSEGNTVDNPRFYRTSQRTLRRKQRQLSRRKKGSHRRRKAAKNVAKTHLKIERQRRDHHFKTAKPYAEGYQLIAVEDLHITNMVKNHHLAKSIMDASWGAFLTILSDKAERAGHCVYVDKSLHPLKQGDSFVEAAGSYNAALDLIHTTLRAESEGERYTGVLHSTTLAFALRV